MKNKILLMAAVFMLMFSFAGQAMAAFTTGDLIRVVYVNGGVGAEVATDLGTFSTYTTPGSIGSTISYTTNDFSLSQFAGQSDWSNISVAYYLKVGTSNASFWLSGPVAGGQSTTGGLKTSLSSGIASTLTYYNGLAGGASQVSGVSSNASSYYSKLDLVGTAVGQFTGYTSGGEVGLAGLSTVGYVDQYLYYYDKATNGSPMSGVAIADIRTFADGHTEIIPMATPLPAAFWLLGSGLMGLVGIRRRMTAA